MSEHGSGRSPMEGPFQSAWARAAAQPVGRGPARPLGTLERLAQLSGWLVEVRAHLTSLQDEPTEHLQAAEWLLDNYFHIQRAVRQVRHDLPPSFYRRLPDLRAGDAEGLPRVHVLAAGILIATDLLPDAVSIREQVQGFQQLAPLGIAELWALPTFLRIGALEQLALALAGAVPSIPSPLPPPPFGPPPGRPDEGERVGCCVQTLRGLDRLDWKTFFSQCSVVEHVLREDPTGIYQASDFETRDRCRKHVEEIAWRTECGEREVAAAAVAMAREHAGQGGWRAHVGAYLIGEARSELERRLAYSPPGTERLRRWLTARPTATLIGGIALATALVLALPVAYLGSLGAGGVAWAVALLLVLIPASTLGVTVVHWFLTNLLPPRLLPKLDLASGIPEDCRALVVVPCLLGSSREVQDLGRQLEVQFLCNPDPNLAFALLSDWLDGPEEEQPSDRQLLERAQKIVQLLNTKHGTAGSGPFHLLHRRRCWNPGQGVWMGRERKRGKLEELNQLLLGTGDHGLEHVVGEAALLAGVPYVITLDAGTVLPRGAAARLIGVLAHPLNRAELDPATGRVARGYTVIQPRVEIAPSSSAQSLFTRMFAGDAAIDIYTRAVSDVYQDLCGEGIYVGKGIYDVAAFARSLEGRVPKNALVSHDHFEGLHGRAGLASDVVLYEDYPPQYLAYARRLHRWIRGDWQLLPWLFPRVPGVEGQRQPNRLSLLGRWILFDNLRRSLLAPSLALLFAAAWLVLPGHPLVWMTLCILAPAGHVFTSLVTGLARGPRRSRVRPWAAGIAYALRENLGRWALYVIFLGHEALAASDAIARTLARLLVTRRHLLDWRSAEHTARLIAGRHPHLLVWTEMVGSPLLALGLGAAVAYRRPESLPWALPLLALWLAAPEIARRISRPRVRARRDPSLEDVAMLREAARRTWLFFEDFVGPGDQWLPPDNYQEEPRGEVAHRTSPTNIGMYLVSVVAARDMGWLGPAELLFRLRETLDTLERMERYRGHVYNWYDTRTLEPLLPRYISTVDSGNLAAALLVVQQASAEATASPALTAERWTGLEDGLRLLEAAVRELAAFAPDLVAEPFLEQCQRIHLRIAEVRGDPARWISALRELCEHDCPAMERRLMDMLEAAPRVSALELLREVQTWIERSHQALCAVEHDVVELVGWARPLAQAPEQVRSLPEFQAVLDALSASLRLSEVPDACRRALAVLPGLAQSAPAAAAWCDELRVALERCSANTLALRDGLLALGVRAERGVREMDFGLLFDAESVLFRIGYDVSTGKHDPNYYDLLASEARIASFLAIAKGDVPVKHWFFLGRPMTRIRGSATLLSWGSTMFEYLMPTLFMRSGERTLLEQSCRVAADTQERYGRRRGVPWGISESGFHLFDAERNYQYRTFGVPGLGLKRGLSEDLVITPYASVLALHLRSDSVIENLGHLERLGARGLYGFYEAVDFTPERVPVGEDFAIVRSHMAHHQGMILASIVNFLQGEPLVRRFHGSSLSQSADLLLYEQVPMGVAPLMQLESVAAPPRPRRDLQPWRPVVGGPWAEFHVLSNGRLTTAVTDSGSGWTSWRELALTRWEADPTCDAQGTWIYVRDEDSREVWSAGARPTRRAADEQHVIFHPHMFEVHRRDRRIFLRMEVAIAPNEDVEVRLLALTNESDEPRRLSLTSCFEPVLAPAREDARHPAFAKLFVESEHLEELSALVFTRRRQAEDGRALAVVHALVGGEDVRLTGHETDRERFLGRGGTWELPSALRGATALSGTTGAVLDPVCALRGELELAPGATVRLAFVTAAADSRDMALDLAKRFRSLTAVEWVFQDAQTAAASEALALSMDARLLPAVQRLTSLVLQPHPALRADSATIEANGLGRPCLWGRGVSGDEPILLVEIDDARRSELLVDLLVAHRFWRRREIPVDLVVLLTGASSYGGESEGRIARLLARSGSADWRNRRGGIFVVSADQMPAEERRLFAVAARALLRAADGRLPELMERLQFERSLPPRFVPGFVPSEIEEPTPPLPEVGRLRHDNGLGGFSADGREYVVHFGEGTPTPAPWCNVLANPGFGCLVSESALGVTWSCNSAEHRLTPWRNDPVSDGPAEALYLRDEETGEVWSTTPLPAGDHARSRVRHGAGYSTFECSSHGLEQSLVIFVPRADPLKVAHLSLRNRWSRQRRLTVTYYAELVLGMTRADSAPFIVPEYDTASGALLARNPWIPEYAGRVTFLCSDAAFHGATADRGEFLGRGGSLRRPAALGRWGLSGRVSAGDDPCLALMVHVELAPGEERELSFLFGDGDDRGHALELARRYRERGAVEAARRELAAYWDGLLGAVEVRTPEPDMDLALNRWLLYQTVACRLEGRTALYQSSGAYGFRDQLQDVLALVHAEPQRTRAQLLEAARHQFEAGDVLHWWHPPGGAGVRTRCSDDLLWLPYVTARYVRATGDRTVLEEQVPFLAGDPLGEGEFERYAQYGPAPEAQDLLEHCRRALRRGLTRGAHGLPLIGSCDWNDGFSRVGVDGRGESVWLAWFAIQVARGFADLLVELGQEAEAAEWRNSADQLARDVDQHAWDGAWYLRAWFDDGDPLGSSRSSDCRIDLIAQAWAAISGAGDAGRARTALASAVEHLVDETVPLVRLLAPPFDAGPRDPGYIKDYPPGIRENGGQYTHAGTWLGFAFAALEDGEWAERVFGLLNPIARARTPEAALRYRVEPYVVAADVYGVPPHVGRGGWTWYTGAAAWLWRLGIEAVLGLRRDGGRLAIEPCIPPHWDGYEAIVRTAAGRCRVVVENPGGTGRGVAGVTLDGVDLPDGLVPLDELTGDHEVRVVLGQAVARREPSA